MRRRVLGVAIACAMAAPMPAWSAEAPAEDVARERNYGVAEYENEEYQKAAGHFQTCVTLAPRSVVDHINLAICAVQGHDHEKAIDALLKARALDPSYPHVPYLLGIVYLRLDDLEKARSEFDTLLPWTRCVRRRTTTSAWC
jgi:tetratricopeptide (TPR) repeat protein